MLVCAEGMWEGSYTHQPQRCPWFSITPIPAPITGPPNNLLHPWATITTRQVGGWREGARRHTYRRGRGSRFAEFHKHRVNCVERGIDLFADLTASEHGTLASLHNNESIRSSKEQYVTLAPVNTILPETKIKRTTFGLIIR